MMSEGDVYITLGASEEVRIEAEDNLLAHLETFVQNGTLVIQTEIGVDIEPTLPIEFHVTVTSLDRVALVGVGDIDVPNLVGNRILLTLSGVGSIDAADLNADELEATTGKRT